MNLKGATAIIVGTDAARALLFLDGGGRPASEDSYAGSLRFFKCGYSNNPITL